MRLNEVTFTDGTPVDSYGPGFFRVGGELYHGAVLTGPKGTSVWEGYADTAPLLALAEEIDVLFIGTGAEIAYIPAELKEALEGAEIGYEVMNSPAACRTYNILLSEGRRIAMAALPVT